jgi:4-hydroxy-3-methylbut-2-en-1-yl diphosphate reductase
LKKDYIKVFNQRMQVQIDQSSGFCFGVERAIKMAETEISDSGKVYCLGEIVHNPAELKRLKDAGLSTLEAIDFNEFQKQKVLFRAHGEPPESYKLAEEKNLKVIDATCPIVLKLQQRIKKAVQKAETTGGQVVVFGKKDHPEITGLSGHAGGKVIVVSGTDDLHQLNFSRPVFLFSQTTANTFDFEEIVSAIKEKMQPYSGNENIPLEINNTICKRVTNRVPVLEKFALEHEVIIFVGGKNSSNGRFLFEVCKKHNKRSFMVEDDKGIDPSWFLGVNLVGISGATSTPVWLLEKIAGKISQF